MTGRPHRLLDAAIRLLPERRRELGRALLAEASVVPPGWRRLAWIAGGAWFVVKESAMRRIGYAVGLAGAVAVLVAVDRIGTSDDSGMVSLLVLLAGAAVLGFVAPRWAWLAALVLGSAIAVSALIGGAYRHRPDTGTGGPATLFVLLVPALVAAYLGAGTAWLLRRSR